MKRKFKLFATVASLCLSVALMAFGVYAASTVTYTVTGSVTFASQVNCTWSVSATYNDTGKTAVGTPDSHTFEPADTGESASHTAPVGEIEFGTEEGHDTVIYTITCRNLGAQAITIDLESAPTLFGNPLLEVTYGGDLSSAPTVGMNQTVGAHNEENDGSDTWTLTITVHLTNLTQTVNTQNTMSIAFVAKSADAE